MRRTLMLSLVASLLLGLIPGYWLGSSQVLRLKADGTCNNDTDLEKQITKRIETASAKVKIKLDTLPDAIKKISDSSQKKLNDPAFRTNIESLLVAELLGGEANLEGRLNKALTGFVTELFSPEAKILEGYINSFTKEPTSEAYEILNLIYFALDSHRGSGMKYNLLKEGGPLVANASFELGAGVLSGAKASFDIFGGVYIKQLNLTLGGGYNACYRYGFGGKGTLSRNVYGLGSGAFDVSGVLSGLRLEHKEGNVRFNVNLVDPSRASVKVEYKTDIPIR